MANLGVDLPPSALQNGVDNINKRSGDVAPTVTSGAKGGYVHVAPKTQNKPSSDTLDSSVSSSDPPPTTSTTNTKKRKAPSKGPSKSKRKAPKRGPYRVPRVHIEFPDVFAPFLKPPNQKSAKVRLLEMKLKVLKEELEKRKLVEARQAKLEATRAQIKSEQAAKAAAAAAAAVAQAQRPSSSSSLPTPHAQQPSPITTTTTPPISTTPAVPTHPTGVAPLPLHIPSLPPRPPCLGGTTPSLMPPHAISPYATTPNGRFRRGTPRSQRKKIHYRFNPLHPVLPALQLCAKVLIDLMNHNWAYPFNEPVDWQRMNIPNYPKIIKHPMDLGTIKRRLETGHYRSGDVIQQFADDVRLVWRNAMAFNRPIHYVHKSAKSLAEIFEKRYIEIQQNPSGAKRPRTPVATPRTPVPYYNNTAQQPRQPDLSYHEKLQLRSDIFKVPADQIHKLIAIVRGDETPGQKVDDGEVEIDMEVLDAPTLRRLQAFVAEHIHRHPRNHRISATAPTPTSNHIGHPPSSTTPQTLGYTARPVGIHSSEEESSSESGSDSESDMEDIHRRHPLAARPSVTSTSKPPSLSLSSSSTSSTSSTTPSSSSSSSSTSLSSKTQSLPSTTSSSTSSASGSTTSAAALKLANQPAPVILTPTTTPKPRIDDNAAGPKWSWASPPKHKTSSQVPPPPPPPQQAKTATKPQTTATTLWQKYQKPATSRPPIPSSSTPRGHPHHHHPSKQSSSSHKPTGRPQQQPQPQIRSHPPSKLRRVVDVPVNNTTTTNTVANGNSHSNNSLVNHTNQPPTQNGQPRPVSSPPSSASSSSSSSAAATTTASSASTPAAASLLSTASSPATPAVPTQPATLNSRVPPQRQPGQQIQSPQIAPAPPIRKTIPPPPRRQDRDKDKDTRRLMHEKRQNEPFVNLNKQNDAMEKLEARFGQRHG